MLRLWHLASKELAVARVFVRKIVRDIGIMVSQRCNCADAIPMPHEYGTVSVGQFAPLS
jgi:hypothetical protein